MVISSLAVNLPSIKYESQNVVTIILPLFVNKGLEIKSVNPLSFLLAE